MENLIYKLSQEEGLSDIHIQTGLPLAKRINGLIIKDETNIPTKAQISKFVKDSLDAESQNALKTKKSLDVALEINKTRFRANFFESLNGLNLALRVIESEIREFTDIDFPPVVEDMLNLHNGLILVTGPTGSGKSTSLAAMINAVNQTRQSNIIIIEDPIEYIHQPKECIISQRELGPHTTSFSSALRAALREDPDVIMVGELRDLETISLALTAAETGHLVFATLHTSGAPNTVNRIIDVFPGDQQGQIRAQLATSLKMVMTQRLIKKADGSGRVPAFEVMTCNTAVQNLIRENKVFQISTAMQTGVADGMVQMEKSIQALVEAGIVNYEDAQ